MAITKQKKGEILAKLRDITNKAKSIVFVNFHGLPVSGASELRSNLRGAEVGYLVAKKTLIKKAFSESKIEGSIPELDGEVALAYGLEDDLIAPAKGVHDYAKKNADWVKIIGGVFEGKFVGAVAMREIASIPSREVLYGQFVNLINSPIQGLAMVLNEIAKKKELSN